MAPPQANAGRICRQGASVGKGPVVNTFEAQQPSCTQKQPAPRRASGPDRHRAGLSVRLHLRQNQHRQFLAGSDRHSLPAASDIAPIYASPCDSVRPRAERADNLRHPWAEECESLRIAGGPLGRGAHLLPNCLSHVARYPCQHRSQHGGRRVQLGRFEAQCFTVTC